MVTLKIGASVYFDIHYKNAHIEKYGPIICYSLLPNTYEFKNIEKISLTKFKCSETEEYTEKYLQYISNMLKLEDVVIKDDYFEFKCLPIRSKNLLVCTLVRILFEVMGGNITTPILNLVFLKSLFEGKCKYRNKLKRFCFFYKKLSSLQGKYYAIGHSWRPNETIIKSTKDFLNYSNDKGNAVNDFFTIKQ